MPNLRQIDQATKFCKCCKIEKPILEFSIKYQETGVLQSKCKECHRQYTREHYRKNKMYWRKQKSSYRKERTDFINHIKSTTPCIDCKNTFPPECMDFDHLRDKKFLISALPRSMTKLKEEMEKCEIVCSNCHRIRTKKRQLAK
jgi:5-methylcytosine-specific restriction endonuclease McrA